MSKSISDVFLSGHGAKHFVCLSYERLDPGEAAPRLLHASCFVVEADGHWFLITAGHVVSAWRKQVAAGSKLAAFWLHDKMAGHAFDGGVPLPYSPEDWVVIESQEEGADFAACPLDTLTVANLDAGGVWPIDEQAWGKSPLEQYERWVVVGIPEESYSKVGASHMFKLTILPLTPTSAPSDPKPDLLYAKIVTQPEIDEAKVNSVGGMSGSPVFGISAVDGGLKYWLIGVQSGWYRASRIVSFCPLLPFLASLRDALSTFKHLHPDATIAEPPQASAD